MHVITIAGIRPDFIRLASLIEKLDAHPEIQHTLIHTGQHYDKNLSEIFFQDLGIREPDYNLGCAKGSHIDQFCDLLPKVINLLSKIVDKRSEHIVMFLGDSNSVMLAPSLKKECYRIGHIEALMRSHDIRMLEEINRICCDSVSDELFAYHPNYLPHGDRLFGRKYVVGNTIVEPTLKYRPTTVKTRWHIVLDIHRPENFEDPYRLSKIFDIASDAGVYFGLPVYTLMMPRTIQALTKFGISTKRLNLIPPVGYKEYLELQHNALFIISDSGTAMEESCLLNTPTFIPREFTERPESYQNNCSVYLPLRDIDAYWMQYHIEQQNILRDTTWLGDGTTSQQIVDILTE